MIGHHYRSVKFDSIPVIMRAVLKDHIASIGWERILTQLSESHKDRPVGLLVMGKTAVVIVIVESWIRAWII